METQEVKALIEKYKVGLATGAEQGILENWYARESLRQMQKPELEDYVRIKKEIWNNVEVQLPVVKGAKLWPKLIGVAAAVAAVVVGIFLFKAKPKELAFVAPRGSTSHFSLPDGTQVWLNADSKISIQSHFSGPQRKVLLDGEAYFEVIKNKNAPFIVSSKGQTVEVLGTHFNINAYKDEPDTKTTLLEGSVKVTTADTVIMLKPNQQAILTKTFKARLQVVLDAERAIAWAGVKGKPTFVFSNEDLESVMRKISRQYNVDIVYQRTRKDSPNFSGMTYVDRNLSSLTKLLEATGEVHFKMEGNKLIVLD